MAKCRKCGCTRLYSELQWDTVIGYECSNCGHYWSIGSVGGFPGEHYFIPDPDPDYYEDEERMNELQEQEREYDEVAEQLGLSKEALDKLQEAQQEDNPHNFEEDDDLPF